MFSDVCEGRLSCQGSIKNYCIDPKFRCDNYTNCAFLGYAEDEADCFSKFYLNFYFFTEMSYR